MRHTIFLVLLSLVNGCCDNPAFAQTIVSTSQSPQIISAWSSGGSGSDTPKVYSGTPKVTPKVDPIERVPVSVPVAPAAPSEWPEDVTVELWSADWCGLCPAVKASLKELQANVVIHEAQYDQNTKKFTGAAAARHISALPYMIFMRDGEDISRFAGNASSDTILAAAKRAAATSTQTAAEPQRKEVVSSQGQQSGSISYRSVSRPRWNVEGNWNPSREYVLQHLRNNSNHRGKFWQSWPLESWTRGQLLALHDDDHVGRVQSTTSSSPSVLVSQPVQFRSYSPIVRRSYCPTCPR